MKTSSTHCRTRWKSASTRSSPPGQSGAPDDRPRRPLPRRAVRRLLRPSGSPTTGVQALFAQLHDRITRPAPEAERRMRPVLLDMDGFAVVPGTGDRRLRRRRLLRPGRADRLGQVHRHRRDDASPCTAPCRAGRTSGWYVRAGADRRPRHGALIFDVGGQRYVVAREVRRRQNGG